MVQNILSIQVGDTLAQRKRKYCKGLGQIFSSTGDGIKSADRNLATILFTDIEDSQSK